MINKVSQDVVDLVISTVLKKKELKGVDVSFVLKELDLFLRQDAKAAKYLRSSEVNVRNSEFKRVVKTVRGRLRRYHGLFVGSERDYDSFRKKFDDVKGFVGLKKVALEALETHVSSKERMDDYGFVWKEIFASCGQVNSVIDLGCGFNPLSLVYLSKGKKGLGDLNYYAYDINKDEKKLLSGFFARLSEIVPGFKGKSAILDLFDFAKIPKLPKSDLCLMFKVTDHLDKGKGHKNTEKVVVAVPSRFVALSFPTVTRMGKPMKYPKRNWVKLMCERLGYVVSSFQTSNELFYVIEK